ncbi:hypothetical protein LR48_Vigan04g057000 [Vigna angularis]|uniref:Uncharacterized protein n=1 Tax=Phaseolus angularis TaxID=3914 RepID=A0A0L9UCT6_PHAAN|nr:hypothetical protein LR48_Vigan04g057000 [Vigna angularis]
MKKKVVDEVKDCLKLEKIKQSQAYSVPRGPLFGSSAMKKNNAKLYSVPFEEYPIPHIFTNPSVRCHDVAQNRVSADDKLADDRPLVLQLHYLYRFAALKKRTFH